MKHKLLCCCLALNSSAVAAAGFQLFEQSGSGMGTAFAGSAAIAEDASTIFFNPAGLTRLSGSQLVSALHVLKPSAEFNNRGSRVVTGAPLTGGNGGDAGDYGYLPNAYFAYELNPRIRLGMGLNAPFGLKTDYDEGWVGRYHALESDLKVVNFNPAIAFKINELVSIGAGFNAQYARAELSNAIDFGAVCFGTLGPGSCSALGITPQARDGRVAVEGNDWSYGYNLGILLQPTAVTRVGLAYRSRIKHTIEGDADFTVPAGATILTAGGAFRDTDAAADVTFPEMVSLSGYTEINPRWALLADVSWTRWSRFQELRVRFANPAQPDAVTVQNWDDTFRVSLGVIYRYSDALTLKAGAAYDESAAPDGFRTPRIPDEDRTWLSVGAGWRFLPHSRLDFGYSYLFVKDASINLTSAAAGTLIGEYDADVNIVSVQYTHSF